MKFPLISILLECYYLEDKTIKYRWRCCKLFEQITLIPTWIQIKLVKLKLLFRHDKLEINGALFGFPSKLILSSLPEFLQTEMILCDQPQNKIVLNQTQNLLFIVYLRKWFREFRKQSLFRPKKMFHIERPILFWTNKTDQKKYQSI